MRQPVSVLSKESNRGLPRRLDAAIPGDLQNICLKALEKDPKDRYNSTRELAGDMQRFLAGEPVLAAPATYSRLISGKIDQHMRELSVWRQDHILSAQRPLRQSTSVFGAGKAVS